METTIQMNKYTLLKIFMYGTKTQLLNYFKNAQKVNHNANVLAITPEMNKYSPIVSAIKGISDIAMLLLITVDTVAYQI